MGFLGDLSKKAARAAGNRALEAAKGAVAPKVVKHGSRSHGPAAGIPVSDEEIIVGANLSKAKKIADHTRSAVLAIEETRSLDIRSWARKYAPGSETFSLDMSQPHRGTILEVTCRDVPTAKLVCRELHGFVTQNPIATGVGYEVGQKGKGLVLVTFVLPE